MTIQNPTASDLAAFVQDQDQKNSDLALRAKAMSDLPRIRPDVGPRLAGLHDPLRPGA